MALAFSPYIGDGTRRNPFRPKHEGAAIDLRPDCTVPDGYALVNTSERTRHKLGEDFKDTFGYRIRNRTHNLLGVDVSRVNRFDVLAAKILLEPNGWGVLRPTRDRYEIWLGGLVWEFPLIRGGSADDFNRANATLSSPWTKIGGNNFVIASNEMKASGVSDADSMWVYLGASVGNNQYAEATTVASVIADGGPVVRGQQVTGSINGYVFAWAVHVLAKFVTGAFTSLTNGGNQDISDYAGSTFPGDTVGLRAVGSTITAYRVGGPDPYTDTADSVVTDTSIPGTGGTSSGLPGFFWFERSNTITAWEGGDYPPVSTPQVLSMQPHISGHGVW